MIETVTGFADEELAPIEDALEHLNGRHPDTLAFLARHLGAGDGATSATLVEPHPDRIDLAVAGGHRLTLRFDPPVSGRDELWRQLVAAVATARSATGDGAPLTSLEKELATTALIRTHPVRVVANEPVTGTLREVRMTGLDGFDPAGPDVFFYALVSLEGTIDPTYSMTDYKAQPPDGPVRGAYYTVRDWDPETSTVTFWVVLHDHEGGVATWMRHAAPGDELVLWGPRLGFEAPADVDQLLLIADETGYAAVARIIEQLPNGPEAVAVLERGEEDPPPMPERDGVEYRWVRRTGEPGTGDELVEAVSAVDLGAGRWAAFGAAESRQVTRIRRLLRHERSLAATHVSMVGYWRRSDLVADVDIDGRKRSETLESSAPR